MDIINNSTFEQIKHLDEDNKEYWLARELQTTLQYTKWANFNKVIETVKNSAKSDGKSSGGNYILLSNWCRIFFFYFFHFFFWS